MMVVVVMSEEKRVRNSSKTKLKRTSSSFTTGDKRSLSLSPSMSTSSSCFSHPKTLTSSVSLDERLAQPPPGSVVGVEAFDGEFDRFIVKPVGIRNFDVVVVVVLVLEEEEEEEVEDIDASGEFDRFIDVWIERSSVATDDDR